MRVCLSTNLLTMVADAAVFHWSEEGEVLTILTKEPTWREKETKRDRHGTHVRSVVATATTRTVRCRTLAS